jgi:putative nucleotidyltransferase with HDIG domain
MGGSAPQFWRDLVAQALASRENKTVDMECDGKVYSMIVTPVAESGYVNLYGRDITERKQAEERIQRQLEHLTALSAIDRVIASIFDLKLCLSEILTHVTMELGVDAADILILNSNLHMLEYSVERGFRSKAVRKTQVRLGESYAGRVALERHLVQIPNLRNEPDNLSLKTFVTDEDFVCYFGVPLIFKGQINGVLEVFHRATLVPDEEWFDFLNTLAGQTAIAIENSTLFERLQRSSSELSMAYDATIEGWSHALDLRDKETEGHTQRVTEMTVKLARLFGLSEAELAQVRWGALLHDIGKMGVPDGILLKPGPLTDEEWVVMKKHPTFAYEMLSPIRYLRLALDIPYCHHEKWDGSGYPRGLKGEQIPLVARTFAVVDVWDALTSDRPYRQAWSEEKARQHIQAEAGTHFDPQVVKEFFLEHG